jgi:predicted metal-dependent phosphoesterase TrpH/glycosyltransferase involved in cell wall biosynthesis
MGLRICLVTPFSWSQPNEANDHVAGVAAALNRREHDVTVLAPSGRAADLLAGRRALARGELGDVVALGRALPISRHSRLGVPVGVRANLALALQRGGFDVVHAFEPGLPSLSYLALLEAETLTAATFLSIDRLGYPTRRTQREKLLARIDALLAVSPEVAAVAAERFPGDYELLPLGVDTERFAPGPKRRLIAVEVRVDALAVARAVLRSLRGLPDWEVALVRTAPLATRPAIPLSVRDRVRVRSLVRLEARATLLSEAAILVPAAEGSARLRLEAMASGCAIAAPAGVTEQPELAAAAVARLADDEQFRVAESEKSRAAAELQSFDRAAADLEAVYARIGGRRRRQRRGAEPLADREWIVADLHMHTSYSGDCSIPVADLLDHAEAEGLGAIAVTDHNVFAGALEAAALARTRDLIVIPGEEVKTDNQGEVIGLFLDYEVPRGMSFTDTVAAIREQGGLVYVPHPFDRMHAIPDPATLHRHLPEIDVFEVYNARLLFDGYNDEALRFASKYGLLAGAGSDAHVLPGVGTGALRLRRFDGPEEFLLALRTAEVLRRPKSLAYLQSLKWVAQARDKFAPTT